MPTFNRILCPVDLSDTSGHAVTVASALSARSACQLTLQYVYVPMLMPVPALPAPGDRVPAGESERVTEDVRRFAMAAGCPSSVPIVVDVGKPDFEILKRAGQDKTDLIVMGTHGASGFSHLVLGSVTEKVLRQAPCPVLTVPPDAAVAAAVPFRKIICAVDFSDWSVAALELAASLAQENGAALVAVNAIEWPWPEPPAPIFAELLPAQAAALLEFRRYMSERATARLSDLVRDVIQDKCAVAIEIAHGKPHVELVRSAKAHQADLVVLGLHGRSAVDLAVFGSTTNQVIRHATCPVLTVRR